MTRPALSVGQSVRVTSISRASPALVKQGMLEVRVGDCGEVATEPDSNGLFQLALSRWTVYWHEEDVERMTYEPMTDAELLALQEKWRDVIPLWWQGVTGPLTPDQEKDLERYYAYCRPAPIAPLRGTIKFDNTRAHYERHTTEAELMQVDNSVEAIAERMRLASEVRMADIWGRCLVSALVGGLLGYCLGAWAHVHWLGR